MTETATPKSQNQQASCGLSEDARLPIVAMLSHQGRVRHANEDACAAQRELGAFVVCDGMGGAAAGEVASQLAADAFLHSLEQPRRRRTRRTSPSSSPDAAPCSAVDNEWTIYPESHPHCRLHEAVCAANQAVFRQSRRLSGQRGMATTLVGALWDRSDAVTLWLAHVGDSRCYRLRGGVIQLLTEDHSLVEEQVRAGTLSRIEASASPIRNIITRAVGSGPDVEPEIAAHATQPGDVYLLTTDGLTRELDDCEIARILTNFVPDPITATAERSGREAVLEAACDALIDAANVRGGRDNITVLLIAFS